MFGRKQTREEEFATRKDFQKIFSEDMNNLHLLALLLTADQDVAAECFVAGLEDSIGGNAVFAQWARSWSKRAIIKNAIKAVTPQPGDPLPDKKAEAQMDGATAGDFNRQEILQAVTALAPFERFVFVMSVLEGYSVQECSSLLNCTVQQVVAAQQLALRDLSQVELAQPATPNCFALPRRAMLAADVA
jgi:DNA-directed RNA polymerase specialized sigma24 family protein